MDLFGAAFPPPQYQAPLHIQAKFSDALMHRLRRSGDRAPKSRMETGTMQSWHSKYTQAYMEFCQTMNPLDLLRMTAVSVKYTVSRSIPEALDGHDISVCMRLGKIITLYVDITPKGVKCSDVIPSTELH